MLKALGEIKDPSSVEPLLWKLDEKYSRVRQEALGALVNITGDEIDQKLLSGDYKNGYLRLDPKEPISEKRVGEGASKLKLSEEDIRGRYEALAEKFNLKLGWKPSK